MTSVSLSSMGIQPVPARRGQKTLKKRLAVRLATYLPIPIISETAQKLNTLPCRFRTEV
jgi:hypothetical protein